MCKTLIACAFALALDGPSLYYAAGTGVFRVEHAVAPVTLASFDAPVQAMALAAAEAYVATASQLHVVPLAGGAPLHVDTSRGIITELAMTATHVAYTVQPAPGNSSPVDEVVLLCRQP